MTLVAVVGYFGWVQSLIAVVADHLLPSILDLCAGLAPPESAMVAAAAKTEAGCLDI